MATTTKSKTTTSSVKRTKGILANMYRTIENTVIATNNLSQIAVASTELTLEATHKSIHAVQAIEIKNL